MLDSLMAYFYFDFMDVGKQKLRNLLSLSSSYLLLARIRAVTYSPDAIPHTIVKNRSQVIAQW